MKYLKVLCVLAIALLLTASVYAETQSVKVSGDLAMRGFFRDAYDYRGSTPKPDVTRTGLTSDKPGIGGLNAIGGANQAGTPQSYFMSTAEVQVDADLTDCVTTCISVVNERDWGVRTKIIAQGTSIAPLGNGGYGAFGAGGANEDFAINLNRAYVTLKDFIYSPLTVSVGRQNLWFGKGFIVGSNHLNNTLALSGTRNLNAPEYTVCTAFDSIKAVLDYDPWTITGVYSKIWGNAIAVDDDVDLYGINTGYKFNNYNAEAEGYWFFKRDRQVEKWGPNKGNNDVHTLGLRGSCDPIDIITLNAEAAFQVGSYVGNRSQYSEIDRAAYALDVSAEYRYFTDKLAWKPKVGGEYILYSGQEDMNDPTGGVAGSRSGISTYKGWDPIFRGKFDSAIREFVGTYYSTYDYPARNNQLSTSGDASFTNQHQFLIFGTVEPIDSITLRANYNFFWTYAKYLRTDGSAKGGFIGQEVDLEAVWNYTEDVSFGLLGGFFVPCSDIYYNADKTATDIVGTMKVSF